MVHGYAEALELLTEALAAASEPQDLAVELELALGQLPLDLS